MLINAKKAESRQRELVQNSKGHIFTLKGCGEPVRDPHIVSKTLFLTVHGER